MPAERLHDIRRYSSGSLGRPPDSHDLSQYVSVTVGVDRADQRPSLVMFEVDPNADNAAGVQLHFAHTVPDGKSWKVVVDPEAGVNLPFVRCDKSTCIAVIGGGTPDEATMKSCVEMVTRMRSENHLFLSYSRNGPEYSTAVSLALLKEAYQHILAQLSQPQEPPAKP